MSQNVRVVVTGIDEIDRKLKKLIPALGKKIVRAEMRRALKPVAATAKMLAPVGETGALADAIKIKPGKGRKGEIVLIVSITTADLGGDAFYGAFVNWGTKYIDARLFLTDAYEQHKESAKQAIIQGTLAGIEKLVPSL